MLFKTQNVLLSDMIICLSSVMDWISPSIVGHQLRVAYIAHSIAAELGLSGQEQNDLIFAAVLHDIGAFSLLDRLDSLDYEINAADVHMHGECGYLLLRNFAPFNHVATIIRHHHVAWAQGRGEEFLGEPVTRLSRILCLADRVDALIDRNTEVLGQVNGICRSLAVDAGEVFVPEFVEAFLDLAQREYFWFNLDSLAINRTVVNSLRFINVELDMENLLNLSKVFSHIIDFRCRFTSNHSSGVAGTAAALADIYSFSETGCKMIMVAGYLHDLGKLTIPAEVLHKSSSLTKAEFNIVKKHPFWTYQSLSTVPGLEEINTWASFHHERIDSNGYPFHFKGEELPLGSRIIAVADVFTALTEDRPYRRGMDKPQVEAILNSMVDEHALDGGVVAAVVRHFDVIREARMLEQAHSQRVYDEFYDNANMSRFCTKAA